MTRGVRVASGSGHPEPKTREKYRDRLLRAAIRFRDRKRGGDLDFLAVCDAIFAEIDEAPKFPKPNGDGPTYA